MKKYLSIFLAVIMLLILTSCHSSKKDIIGTLYSNSIETNDEYEPVLLSTNGDYKHELFDGCIIYSGAENKWVLEYNSAKIISGTFYKYSHFNERYVAIHNMILGANTTDSENQIKYSMDMFDIEEYYFFLFDTKEKQSYKFDTLQEFNSKCSELKLSFDNWYYRENKSERMQFSDNCYIDDSGNYMGQTLYFNDIPILEGIITDCEMNDDKLEFKFNIVDSDYGPEFPTVSNKNLDFEKYQSSKRIHITGILFLTAHYSSKISLDLNTGEITEY